MKILFHHRIRSKDGQFVHLDEIVNAFRAQGHDVIIIGPRIVEQAKFGADGGWTDSLRRRLPRWLAEVLEFTYSLVALPRFVRAIHVHRPDFVYERFNLFFPVGAWVTRMTGVRLVLEVNSPLYEERREQPGVALEAFAQWTQRYVWRQADLVLPVTHVLADIMVQYGVDRERILVMPNGVDVHRFHPLDAGTAKGALGLHAHLVLGFVGFVRRWHGLEEVIRAMADNALPSNTLLLVVGDGPVRGDLEALALNLGVAERVRFTGVIERKDLPQYIAAFDVALQPGVTAYASPLKVIEYLAMGKPILAPDQANIREILTDGLNARLFPPESAQARTRALTELASDAWLRTRLAAGAAESIGRLGLDWNQNVRRVVERMRPYARAKS